MKDKILKVNQSKGIKFKKISQSVETDEIIKNVKK